MRSTIISCDALNLNLSICPVILLISVSIIVLFTRNVEYCLAKNFSNRMDCRNQQQDIQTTLKNHDFLYLTQLVKKCNYGRLEWTVLDWNARALKFYCSIGTVPMDEWTVQRVTGEELDLQAGEFEQI